MKLTLESITNDAAQWEAANVKLPQFNIPLMRSRTATSPEWVHFGPGNIFRSVLGSACQTLLNEKMMHTGIIACETLDYEVIDRVYNDTDSLTMSVQISNDGEIEKQVIASIAKGIKADFASAESRAELARIFQTPSLKMVTFTISEKGYNLRNPNGSLLAVAEADMKDGPEKGRHAMSVVTALLYERFKAGQLPLALVSLDNCSRNGDVLKASVVEVAKAWITNGFVAAEFLSYIENESIVSFPWSMLDKITPRPNSMVQSMLAKENIEGMGAVVTAKGVRIAPYVNSEKSQYLVIEDNFPNDRPPLEVAGVYMTDRDTVDKAEKMKVMTCLNPLQTALSIFGYLFGREFACSAMTDEDILPLINRLGYSEGLPVVIDPKIISPIAFLDEAVAVRLANSFLPDDVTRLATDTSHKLAIRFGETIKSYLATGRDLSSLVAIPLTIAGWFRYLLGVDDNGKPMTLAPDPLNNILRTHLKNITWNDPRSYEGELRPLLSNAEMFGLDLSQTPLCDVIEGYFCRMLEGRGAVRAVLQAELTTESALQKSLKSVLKFRRPQN